MPKDSCTRSSTETVNNMFMIPRNFGLVSFVTHRLHCGSFLGLPCRILNMNHKKELPWSLRVVGPKHPGMECKTLEFSGKALRP